jgi:acyl-CoA synthetase (AMP-forming)/AMP-acid ligase II
MPSQPVADYRRVTAQLVAEQGPFAIENWSEPRRRGYKGTADNLIDVFDEAVARYRDNPMYEFEGQRATWGEVLAEADMLADQLRARHGLKPGDRAGIAMRNGPGWFTAFLAVTRSGAVATLLNSRSSADELGAAVDRVGCAIVLSDGRCAERLAGVTDTPVLDEDAVATLIAAANEPAAPIRTAPDAPAVIIFTSGTTGRPKGATLSQHNLCTLVRQIQYQGAHGLITASERLRIELAKLAVNASRPSVLMIFPMFHISGIVNLVTAMVGGGLMSIMSRWDPAVAIELIERNKVTSVSGPTLVVSDLLDQPDAARRLAGLRGVVVGGQASPPALVARVRATLPQTGQAAGWGMTEATGSITSASGAVFDHHSGTVGVALPLNEIEVRDAEDRPLPPGEVGELLVRGPMVMLGYWDDPEANAACFDGDWLRTGDMGFVDEDGLITIVDRAKDMVLCAGENIYCAEVERVLAMDEGHVEVALFGVPCERLGERAVAAIVLREGAGSGDAEAVRALVRQYLADYKVPHEVLFLPPLPRTALGKVDKKALRRLYEERAVVAR